MTTMGGNPPNEVTLHRHAAQNSQRVDDHRAGLEAGMSEKAVIPDRDPETRQKVHRDEERQVEGAEVSAPKKNHGHDHADRRQKNHHEADQLPEKLHLMYALYGTIR